MLVVERTIGPRAALNYSLGPGHVLTLSVKASDPVLIHVVDNVNYQRARNRLPFTQHGPGLIGLRFLGPISLPHGGPWWLLIANRSENIVSVDVEFAVM